MHYKHTQTGILVIAVLLFFIIFSAALFIIRDIPTPLSISYSALMAMVLFLFYALRVEVKDSLITCAFGAGLIRKKIKISEIENINMVRNPWYAGWGIRWMPGQYWMWNISGFEAVELVMKNGKKFRIGTDEPEELYNVINTFNERSF